MNEKLPESRICEVDGCDRKHYSLGFCNAHYQQFKRQEKLGTVRPNRSNGKASERDYLGRKLCIECDEWKDESEFSTHGGTRDKLQVYCKKCYRRRDSARQYGVDPYFFEAAIEALDGICPICKRKSERWAIDHDHSCCKGNKSCGKCVRGVICQMCNVGLGSFNDDVDALESAIKYLKGELGAK